MFELFSDLFALRDNAFTRMDVRVKLLITGIGIFAVILSGNAAFGILMFAVSVSCMVAVRIPLKIMLIRLALPLAMALLMVVIKSFLPGLGKDILFHFAGMEIAASGDGFRDGILVASRVMGASGIALLLGFVTPAYQLFAGLGWFRISSAWVELAMMTYRYIFVLLEVASEMAAAQRVRLGYAGWSRSLSSFSTLAGGVVLRSAEQATSTHEAMLARGYCGGTGYTHLHPPRFRDFALVFVASALIASGYFLCKSGGM